MRAKTNHYPNVVSYYKEYIMKRQERRLSYTSLRHAHTELGIFKPPHLYPSNDLFNNIRFKLNLLNTEITQRSLCLVLLLFLFTSCALRFQGTL